jgi:hypothetical protein
MVMLGIMSNIMTLHFVPHEFIMICSIIPHFSLGELRWKRIIRIKREGRLWKRILSRVGNHSTARKDGFIAGKAVGATSGAAAGSNRDAQKNCWKCPGKVTPITLSTVCSGVCKLQYPKPHGLKPTLGGQFFIFTQYPTTIIWGITEFPIIFIGRRCSY